MDFLVLCQTCEVHGYPADENATPDKDSPRTQAPNAKDRTHERKPRTLRSRTQPERERNRTQGANAPNAWHTDAKVPNKASKRLGGALELNELNELKDLFEFDELNELN